MRSASGVLPGAYRYFENLDLKREADPNWYKKNDMLGMMFYIDNFAGNMKGVESKIDYLEKNNVNYIHLMPFLDTPEGRSDGAMQWQTSERFRKSLELWKIWRRLPVHAMKKA